MTPNIKEKEKQKEWYQENKERLRLKNRKYNQQNKESILKKKKEWNKKNPEKVEKARKKHLVKNKFKRTAETRASRNIKISKGQLCEICKGRKATQRHHEDYSKPLEIMFVCGNCHRSIHILLRDYQRKIKKVIDEEIEIQEKMGKEQRQHKRSIEWRIIGLKLVKQKLGIK